MDHFPRDWGENKTCLKSPPGKNKSNLDKSQKDMEMAATRFLGGLGNTWLAKELHNTM